MVFSVGETLHERRGCRGREVRLLKPTLSCSSDYKVLSYNRRKTCPRTKVTGDECEVMHAARPLEPCTVSRAGIIT